MPRSPGLRIWLLLWLVLSTSLLVANRELFSVPVYEEGDDASNALAIGRATHGEQLHGNYSRFMFHHPGPGFFYVYAAGEFVFHRCLGVVPERHNAHILAGGLLQLAFLAGAMSLIARRTTRPLTMAALLLLAAMLHLASIQSLPVNVWPPFVVVLPLLCFVVAAAGIATGQWYGWLWLVSSGLFLLHGHVAQAMFVVPLGLGSLGLGLWNRYKRPYRDAFFPPEPFGLRRWLITLALVAVFATPLLIDLSHGSDGNLQRILMHLRLADPNDRPGWGAAVASVFSYFGYCITQEDWFWSGSTNTASQYFQAYGRAVAVWAVIAVFWLIGLWRTRKASDDLSCYARFLSIFFGMVIVLAIFWAKRQDAGIAGFNSYFLLGQMYVLAAMTLMVWFPLLSKARAWFWASLAAFALVWFLPTLATRAQRTNERANAIAKAQAGLLAEDPLPKSPKMLLFPHGLWYETVTLAAALDRGGLNHFVAPIWRVMFGDPHQLYRASLAEAHQPLSWWQIDTPLKAQGEEWKHWIKEAKVRFLEPADFGALPMTLNFAKDGNVDPNTSYGLSLTDPDFTWTESKRILLRWKAYRTERDVVVTLDLGAFTAHKVKEQKVSLAVNGEHCGSFSVAKRSSLQVRIPQAVWNRGLAKRENTLSLDIPDATSPAEHRFSADRRLLGLQLYSMYFSAME